MAQVIATAMDLIPGVGDGILGKAGSADLSLVELLTDEVALHNYIKANVSPLGHNCGTCRMGTPHDPDAVVDTRGRVFGVPGLRIADASVMPSVPRGNTNLPTLMVAEKLASAILGK